MATSPQHSRPGNVDGPLRQTVSGNHTGPDPGGGVTFNLWDEEEEKRHRRAWGLEK